MREQAAVDPDCNIRTTERIVAVGDVHGAFDRFVAILQEAGLIDRRRRWSGGRAILVQTGDVVDRGPDSREALDLLRKLEGEAARAGGRVYALLGNHEVMRLHNHRQYISAGEYQEFKTIDSEDLRERAFELVAKENADRARAAGQAFDDRAFRKLFFEENPLGSVEMQIAFSPTGEYGKWVRERDAVIKINDILFLHGGISPAVAPMGCAAINKTIRDELKLPAPAEPDKFLATRADGPLWYRGLVDGTAGIGAAEIDAIMKPFDARAIVIGHTSSVDYKIKAVFEGRVVLIDTGMLNGTFYPGGVPSALEIAGETWTAIYEGKREVVRDK